MTRLDNDLTILKHYIELALEKSGVKLQGTDMQSELDEAFSGLSRRLDDFEDFRRRGSNYLLRRELGLGEQS